MTKTNFIALALRNIGKFSVGQTASSTDTTAATVIYNSVYDWLSERGLVTWGVEDDLPDWAVMPMKRYISPDLAREFSVSENRIAFFQAESQVGFDDLLKASSQDWTDEVTTAEYF